VVSFPQPAHKSFRIKRILGKKQRQNRPLPQWIRLRTDNTIRFVRCQFHPTLGQFLSDAVFTYFHRFLCWHDFIFPPVSSATTPSVVTGAAPSWVCKLQVAAMCA
jgi:large subunit ribosomal protein L39e